MAEPAVDAGDAWVELAVGHHRGQVVATFFRAAYLRVGGEVVAVGSTDVPAGPLHLRLLNLPGARPGAPVSIADGMMGIGTSLIDLARTPRWAPPAVDDAGVAAAARRAALLVGGGRSWFAARSDLDDAIEEIATGRLDHLARRISGLGPGLTPAGDDVLAGVMLVHALAGRPASERQAAIDVARTRTGPIPLAFLRWAARGRSIEPVHRLLVALTSADVATVAASQRRVLAIGASSGADLVLGLRVGLQAVERSLRT